MRWFGLIFVAAGLLFLGVGAQQVLKQSAICRRALPVEAVVLGTEVAERMSTDSDGKRSRSYTPVVHFRYTRDGRTHESRRTFVLSFSSGRGWATRVVRDFPVGKTFQAYYDPHAPDEAFALRRPLFFPYMFMLFPMIFVCVGVGIALYGAVPEAKPPAPVAGSPGWFALTPGSSLARRRTAAWLMFGLWDGVGAVALGHYFLTAAPPYDRSAYVTAAIYLLVGAGLLAVAVRNTLLARNLREAQVFINAATLTRGQPITVGVRQGTQESLDITAGRIALVCSETVRTSSGGKSRHETRQRHLEELPALEPRRFQAGETLEYNADLTPPTHVPASSPANASGYPRYRWAIRLTIAIAGQPDYKVEFPVIVA